MFMSTAPPVPHADPVDPSWDRALQDDAAARTSRLLGVVRALIAFGQHLAEALLHRDPTENPVRLIRHFGVATVAEIVNRVAYALRLAMALEARLSRWQAKPPIARGTATATAARPSAQAAPRAKRDPDADDPPPDPLPSVEALVRMIRNWPVGDVIVDICRDFGIAANHPLWWEVYDAVLIYPSSAIRLARVIVNRRHASWTYAPLGVDETVEAEFWPPALRLGTGPP